MEWYEHFTRQADVRRFQFWYERWAKAAGPEDAFHISGLRIYPCILVVEDTL